MQPVSRLLSLYLPHMHTQLQTDKYPDHLINNSFMNLVVMSKGHIKYLNKQNLMKLNALILQFFKNFSLLKILD